MFRARGSLTMKTQKLLKLLEAFTSISHYRKSSLASRSRSARCTSDPLSSDKGFTYSNIPRGCKAPTGSTGFTSMQAAPSLAALRVPISRSLRFLRQRGTL
ncbi:hypothetical protein IG631_10105 [Alternaria alternata]|nr:hypothetical protein IG631_10105 [Alternaria alternata]